MDYAPLFLLGTAVLLGYLSKGDAPFTHEMLERQGQPGLVIHHYAAAESCALDDEDAWHEANPGLKAGIKAIEYMRHQSLRAMATPADAPSFRAFDLNQPQVTSGQLLVEAQDWAACEDRHVTRIRQGRWSLALTCPVAMP